MTIYDDLRKMGSMETLLENVVTVTVPLGDANINDVDDLDRKLANILGVSISDVEIIVNGDTNKIVANIDGEHDSDEIEKELKLLIGLNEDKSLEEMALPDVRRLPAHELDKLSKSLANKSKDVLRKYQDDLIKRVGQFLKSGKKEPAAEEQAKQSFLATVLGDMIPATESLKENEGSLGHGDIVKFIDGSAYFREGYFRIDTEEAVGATADNPWVGDLKDNNGWYVNASELEVVICAGEYDTEGLTNDEEVEDYLNNMDESYTGNHEEEADAALEDGGKIESMTEAELASKLANSVKAPKPEKVDIKGGKVDEDKSEGVEGTEWIEELYLKLCARDLRALHRVVMSFDSSINKNATYTSIDVGLKDLVGAEIYDGGGLKGISERSGIETKALVALVNYLITGDNEIDIYDAKPEKAKEIK